jgi:hypothetical protein
MLSMTKLTVVLLADAETHEAMGRAANAFELVKEAKQAKNDVELILDGAATRWAGAFGVKEAVRAAGLPLVGEFDGHPSLAQRIAAGRQVVTF